MLACCPMASPSADQTPRELNADRTALSDAPSDALSDAPSDAADAAAADADDDDDEDDAADDDDDEAAECAFGGWTPRELRSSDHVVRPAGTGVAAAFAELSPIASNVPNRAHQP
jgi:hypothetical protein